MRSWGWSSIDHMNPTSAMYLLHSLQEHSSVDQDFITLLKDSKDSQFFMLCGTSSHIFDAKYLIDWRPYLVVLIFSSKNVFFCP